MCGVDRRSFLRAVPGAFFASTFAETVRAQEPSRDDFDPAIHAFGFQNWSTAVPTFPEHDHDAVTEAQVSRVIRSDWEDPLDQALGINVPRLAKPLVDAIATQVYVSANQFSATNGHCFGMVYAAQQYYEQPETMPFEETIASDLTNPAAPLDSPAAPVGSEIDLFQVSQVLNPHAWLGRRGIVRPTWIDLDRQVDNVAAVLAEYGTAGIMLIDHGSFYSHQVLAYEYDRSGSTSRIWIYDPNRPASWYGKGNETVLTITHSEDGAQMEPYGEYETVIFNRHDRLGAATDDEPASTPALNRDSDRLGDLFRLATFLVDDPAVCLSVIDPAGEPVERDESTFMDRTATEYHSMRYSYDAESGEYTVSVVAREPTTYTLTIEAAAPDGELFLTQQRAAIDAGETHEYTVSIPDSPDGDGSIDRVQSRPWPAVIGGAAGGAAIGAIGYGSYRYLKRDPDR